MKEQKKIIEKLDEIKKKQEELNEELNKVCSRLKWLTNPKARLLDELFDI